MFHQCGLQNASKIPVEKAFTDRPHFFLDVCILYSSNFFWQEIYDLRSHFF
jgi:hypothetical protein